MSEEKGWWVQVLSGGIGGRCLWAHRCEDWDEASELIEELGYDELCTEGNTIYLDGGDE